MLINIFGDVVYRAVRAVTSCLQPSFIYWINFSVWCPESNFAFGLVADRCPDPMLW